MRTSSIKLAIISAITIILLPLNAFAATDDLQSIKRNTVFYDPTLTTDCTTGGSGTLPTTVPEPYNAIFTKAANQFQADPIVIATIFYTEHRGFPAPPPPYGTGSPWASSPAGASGPFQFIPSTWKSHEQDGNGDGKKDIQDLTDAAYGAAQFIQQLGGVAGTPYGDDANPKQKPSIVNVFASYNAGPAGNFNNSETIKYIQIAGGIYHQLQSGDVATSSETSDAAENTCSSDSSVTGGSIADIAKSQIGTVGYMKYTPTNEEWCADFVSWVYKQAGKPFTPDRIPAVASLMSWFQAKGIWVPRGSGQTPEVGDVVIWNGSEHTNIVVGVSGDTITVVGGNQGSIKDNAKSKVTQYTAKYKTDTNITGWGRMK